MKPKISLFIAAGVALAGAALTPSVRGQTTVFFAGGNASQTLLYDRVTNILTGGITSVTVASTNSTVRTYKGSITGAAAGVNPVTIEFSLLGAIQGLDDVSGQDAEYTADGLSLAPNVAVSSSSAAAVGVNAAPFTAVTTLAVPYAFIKPPTATLLAGVTNLTQRQANYLEGSAGSIPISFFGGTATNYLYFVGRNTSSAVRTETDANIFFSGTLATFVTNGSGQPIFDVSGGQSSGANVRSQLGGITNAIGTVAFQDISTFPTLTYEGVAPTVANIETGSYPLWYYEQWYYPSVSQPGAPSANQTTVINLLLGAITNSTYQTTSSLFVGKFVPLSGLQVYRSVDAGPIQLLP